MITTIIGIIGMLSVPVIPIAAILYSLRKGA